MLSTILLNAKLDVYRFTMVDFLYSFFILFLTYYFAKSIRDKRIETEPEYKYYLIALTLKIVGAITVVLVYNLYYYGGDTNYYFYDARVITNLLFKDARLFADVVFNGMTPEKVSYLDKETGYFTYYKNAQTFFVARIIWPFVLVGFQGFIPTAILLALVSFGGVWRMYKVFITEFPSLYKPLAIAFFFVPSVFFWGSGILKDSITFSAVGYYFHSFYSAFIIRKKIPVNIFVVIISVLIILSIKPYIFIGLLPGSLIWVIRRYTLTIPGSFIRAVSFPVILSIGIVSGYLLLLVLSDELGKYSLDNILEEATISNKDLKSSMYKGNTFDIGEVKPTFESMLQKSPIAINAALFRPYLWESNNILMFVSGFENLLILIFTIYILIKVRVFGFFKYFGKHHLLVFSFIFSMFFAFAVGISTSNFGSLVRYRIPLLPFYVSTLLIIKSLKEKEVEEKRAQAYEYFDAYA